MFDLLQVPVFVVDQGGNVVYGNEAFAELVGRKKRTASGIPIAIADQVRDKRYGEGARHRRKHLPSRPGRRSGPGSISSILGLLRPMTPKGKSRGPWRRSSTGPARNWSCRRSRELVGKDQGRGPVGQGQRQGRGRLQAAGGRYQRDAGRPDQPPQRGCRLYRPDQQGGHPGKDHRGVPWRLQQPQEQPEQSASQRSVCWWTRSVW